MAIRAKYHPQQDVSAWQNIVEHPGHGPETTIGEERRENPFVRG
jgi:hypothetical protein